MEAQLWSDCLNFPRLSINIFTHECCLAFRIFIFIFLRAKERKFGLYTSAPVVVSARPSLPSTLHAITHQDQLGLQDQDHDQDVDDQDPEALTIHLVKRERG
jgi:hypothetical protein